MLEISFESLLECREEIDKIDQKIVELLEYRMKISKDVGEIKKRENIKVLDLSRENKIIEKIKLTVKDEDLKDVISEIYMYIMSKSKDLQKL